MEKLLYYVMFIERGKTYNKINQEMVLKHVEHIKIADISLDFCKNPLYNEYIEQL